MNLHFNIIFNDYLYISLERHIYDIIENKHFVDGHVVLMETPPSYE